MAITEQQRDQLYDAISISRNPTIILSMINAAVAGLPPNTITQKTSKMLDYLNGNPIDIDDGNGGTTPKTIPRNVRDCFLRRFSGDRVFFDSVLTGSGNFTAKDLAELPARHEFALAYVLNNHSGDLNAANLQGLVEDEVIESYAHDTRNLRGGVILQAMRSIADNEGIGSTDDYDRLFNRFQGTSPEAVAQRELFIEALEKNDTFRGMMIGALVESPGFAGVMIQDPDAAQSLSLSDPTALIGLGPKTLKLIAENPDLFTDVRGALSDVMGDIRSGSLSPTEIRQKLQDSGVIADAALMTQFADALYDDNSGKIKDAYKGWTNQITGVLDDLMSGMDSNSLMWQGLALARMFVGSLEGGLGKLLNLGAGLVQEITGAAGQSGLFPSLQSASQNFNGAAQPVSAPIQISRDYKNAFHREMHKPGKDHRNAHDIAESAIAAADPALKPKISEIVLTPEFAAKVVGMPHDRRNTEVAEIEAGVDAGWSKQRILDGFGVPGR